MLAAAGLAISPAAAPLITGSILIANAYVSAGSPFM